MTTHRYRHYTGKYLSLYFCRFRSSRVLRMRLFRLEYRFAWSLSFAAERIKPQNSAVPGHSLDSVVDVLIREMERTA